MFECSYLGQEGGDDTVYHTWRGYSVEHRPALMGQSPVRTTKTSCSRDLPFDLSILSVSFSNDLAVQTFMPSLLFWAMIGCSSKLRSVLCDECISLTFMSPPNPDSHQWIFCGATPARRPFMKTFPQTPFFPHTSSRLAQATQRRLSSGCPSLEKSMCYGTMRELDHMLLCGCAFTLNAAAHQNID